MGRWAVETRLEFTTKGSEAKLGVVSSDVSERVATIVVRLPLVGADAVAVLRVINTAGLLVDAGAALNKVSTDSQRRCLVSSSAVYLQRRCCVRVRLPLRLV